MTCYFKEASEQFIHLLKNCEIINEMSVLNVFFSLRFILYTISKKIFETKKYFTLCLWYNNFFLHAEWKRALNFNISKGFWRAFFQKNFILTFQGDRHLTFKRFAALLNALCSSRCCSIQSMHWKFNFFAENQ